ncbi:ABC transporter permease [Chitinimonas lacunae]|uniref:ABC transporter permease n=1 Tax=Chitinimonas lacunae TaxID=1963018 RepID=A0ABV8MR92_9NEIS
MNAVLNIFRKELTELRRDRKSMIAVLMMVLTSGPLVIALMFFMLSQQLDKLDAPRVAVANLEAAPELVDFLERQGISVEAAPADYAARLRDGRLSVALEIDPDFRADVAAGRPATIRLLADSSRDSFNVVYPHLRRGLQAFDRAWGDNRLILRGVAPQVAHPLGLEEVDLANAGNRGSKMASNLIGFYTLFAGLLGSLAAALELTAGERERQSLEPLMTLPLSPWQIALGKWLAASVYNLAAISGCLLAYLLTLNFAPLPEVGLPFRFGLIEAGNFLVVIMPFALLVPAALLLLGSFGKTVKEAQSTISVGLTLTGLIPLLTMFRSGPPAVWESWLPMTSQMRAMEQVLRGDPIAPLAWFALWLVPLVLTALCLVGLTRNLAAEKLLSSR